MTVTIVFSIAGLIVGGVIAWLFASSKARSAEAVNGELRQQIEQREQELKEVRIELIIEKQTKSAMEAKYQEIEKNLQNLEKELLGKFDTISLQALSKNSQEFLKLAKEKLESQTNEGKQALESKKELIDVSLKAMDKTLSQVQQK
ncbi:MAG: hypothetical protein HZC11_09230, partial [Nitrospirae bacterium]|nr:hypothetical protein [Nitrospirota bacterium]